MWDLVALRQRERRTKHWFYCWSYRDNLFELRIQLKYRKQMYFLWNFPIQLGCEIFWGTDEKRKGNIFIFLTSPDVWLFWRRDPLNWFWKPSMCIARLEHSLTRESQMCFSPFEKGMQKVWRCSSIPTLVGDSLTEIKDQRELYTMTSGHFPTLAMF